MRVFLLLLLVAMAGCTGPLCLQSQDYEDARLLPPLTAPPGLDVPEPDPNLAIPEVSGGGPVGAYPPGEGFGKQHLRCLDAPPPMPST